MSFEALVAGAATKGVASIAGGVFRDKPNNPKVVEERWEKGGDGSWSLWVREQDPMGRERLRQHFAKSKLVWNVREYWRNMNTGKFYYSPVAFFDESRPPSIPQFDFDSISFYGDMACPSGDVQEYTFLLFLRFLNPEESVLSDGVLEFPKAQGYIGTSVDGMPMLACLYKSKVKGKNVGAYFVRHPQHGWVLGRVFDAETQELLW